MNEQETSHDATGQLPPQSAQRANGSRVAIALACWLLSIIGILMSLMMIVGVSIASLLTKPISEVIQSRSFYLGVGTAYAWTALAVMTSSWVSNRPVAGHWPLIGGMMGVICSGFFVAFIPLYLSCALLGMYLCYFHLAGYRPDEHNAA